MPKNIEMSVLGSDGSYEVLYPYTIPSQVENLLNDDTKTLMGLDSSATPDDAFKELYFLNVLADKCAFQLTVTSPAGTPLEGIQIASTSFIDANGNPVAGPLVTDANGRINTYFKSGKVTLSISGYADIENKSQSYDVLNGEQYEYSWTVNLVNFRKYTSSRNVKFSPNVNNIDVTCVGGGGGGAMTDTAHDRDYETGGGGAGGYCIVQTSVSFNENNNYNMIIGSGGVAGTTSGTGQEYGKTGGTTSFLEISAQGGEGGQSPGDNASIGNGNGGYYRWNGSYNFSAINATAGTVAGYSSFTETVVYGGGGSGMYYNGSEEGYLDTKATLSAGYGGDAGKNGSSGYGGGGGSRWANSGGVNAGSGGSGCVAIRMHLKTAV